MRKAVIFLFLLLSITAVASGQSLFPMLSSSEESSESSKPESAPSFSAFANVEPNEVRDFGSDGKALVYNWVSEDQYMQFGEYLAGFGFEVTESNVNGRVAELMLSNEQFNIGVSYNGNDEVLYVIYEEGVDYQKMDYFVGYKRVKYSDVINIKDWGSIRINKFVLNEPIQIANEELPTWMIFEVTNSTNQEIRFKSHKFENHQIVVVNDIGEITLHYIKNRQQIMFPMQIYEPYYINYVDDSVDVFLEKFDSYSVLPFSTQEFIVGFRKLPPDVCNSTDGTFAVTFDFITGDKYVIFLREDGVDLW